MSRIPNILWKSIETILPHKKSSRGKPAMNPKTAMEGILYILRTGCQWSKLPRYFGAPSTVHGKFLKWARMEVFQLIFDAAKNFYLSHNQENIWYTIHASLSKAPLANFSEKSRVLATNRRRKKDTISVYPSHR